MAHTSLKLNSIIGKWNVHLCPIEKDVEEHILKQGLAKEVQVKLSMHICNV